MGNIAKIGWVVACVLIGPACHAPEPGPTAPLPPSLVTIRGSVADAVDWLGPVAAKIEVIGGPLSGLSTTTDRNGAFELTGPFGNTNVTLRVSAEPYYATRTFTVTVDQGGRCACDFSMISTTVPNVGGLNRSDQLVQ